MMTAQGLKAEEIAQAIRGRIEGNGGVMIEGAAGLEEAQAHQISFFQNPKYTDLLLQTKAGVILIAEKTNGLPLPEGKTLIRVPNPPLAFAQVLSLFQRRQVRHPNAGVHASAVVDPTAVIAKNVAIGARCVIEQGVQIGSGTIIYGGCYLGVNTHIGENCLI